MKEFHFDDFFRSLLSHPKFTGNCRRKRYQKGEHIFTQGEIRREVFCLHHGLVKLYFNTREGKEWIKSFVADRGVFGSRSGQVEGKPSPFSVSCLEDCEIVVLPYDIFEQICFDDPALARMVFLFNQWLGAKKEKREFQLLCLSAEEAYSEFVNSNPGLVSRLTQIDISRYLGITPIALSRIKKRLSSENSHPVCGMYNHVRQHK